MAPVWKDVYLGYEQWTTWSHVLDQHWQLLLTGGQICKVLIRNQTGTPVGDQENPIPISVWNSDSTSTSPRKRIWTSGDDETLYPNPDSVRVFVDSTELHRTYNYKTIQTNNEFYVEVQDKKLDYVDNVSIYLNKGYSTTGHAITYLYTARAKSINLFNQQPKQDQTNFRSLFGFTQYINPSYTFRNMSFPHSIAISFPPPPPLDTKFSGFGKAEQWQNRAWTLGDPLILHEFDIIYRVSDQRWYELRDIEPNVIMYKGVWKVMTQSFTLTQVGPNDVIRQFPLI
jgi:hypothetical protein